MGGQDTTGDPNIRPRLLLEVRMPMARASNRDLLAPIDDSTPFTSRNTTKMSQELLTHSIIFPLEDGMFI